MAVIEFSASLDMDSTDRFRHAYNAMLEEVAAEGFTDGDLIVLDLSRIDFVSIDATSALVEAKERARDHGFEFKLVTATRGVDRALAATGAGQLIACHPTVESAVGCDPIGQMS